jgi:hypothetical protein
MKWVVLVNRSTITQIESFLLEVHGKPTIKSILMSSHFHKGIVNCWSTPADFKWLALTQWQVSHSATYLAMSTFMFEHQKFFLKSWYILVLSEWIENLERWASSKIFFRSFGSTWTTKCCSKHTTSFESLRKQLYLGSSFAIFYFISWMPSSSSESKRFCHIDWTQQG